MSNIQWFHCLLQKRSNDKLKYDLQNIEYSPKNGCQTKYIEKEINDENRLA